MRKRGYLRSVPARATNRRDSSSPSREANRKVLLRSPTRICLTRFALSPARTGFPASVTGCAGSGLLMQKPCALTSMKGFRRTFALLRRAVTQNNPWYSGRKGRAKEQRQATWVRKPPLPFLPGVSQSLCKPPNWCKIKLLSLEVIFMARRKDSPQKAAMREMMRDYLKNNDIRVSA